MSSEKRPKKKLKTLSKYTVAGQPAHVFSTLAPSGFYFEYVSDVSTDTEEDTRIIQEFARKRRVSPESVVPSPASSEVVVVVPPAVVVPPPAVVVPPAPASAAVVVPQQEHYNPNSREAILLDVSKKYYYYYSQFKRPKNLCESVVKNQLLLLKALVVGPPPERYNPFSLEVVLLHIAKNYYIYNIRSSRPLDLCYNADFQEVVEDQLRDFNLLLQAEASLGESVQAIAEEIDEEVGFWVDGLPYQLVSPERPTSLVRVYVDDVSGVNFRAKPNRRLQKNDLENIGLLFHNLAVVDPRDNFRKNGRHFYYIEGRREPSVVHKNITPVVYLYPYPGDYSEFKPMYHLICTGFKGVKKRAFLQGTNVVQCTRYGSKIAKSLIRVASTRIFADPEQSIMELPVNSVDSYNPGSQVGKFGMGFFSILYWLVGHPHRSLDIRSYYKYKDNHLMFYCVVKECNNQLEFRLVYNRETNVTQTGTIVTLNCPPEDPLSPHNVEEFINQLKRLSYITNALIAYRTKDTPQFVQLNKGSDIHSDKKIYVHVAADKLEIEDYAEGMSLKVLLRKLFVPSVSTKTIQGASLVQEQKREEASVTILKESTQNLFVILVRSVAVVYISVPVIFEPLFEVIIDLPGNTRVPVSRDDVLLNDVTKMLLTNELNNLVAQCLERRNILVLQQALKAYLVYTTLSENKAFFGNYLNAIQVPQEYYLVDHTHFDLLSIFDVGPEKRFVVSERTEVAKLEAYLTANVPFLSNVFWRKKVVILPFVSNTATNAGLTSFVFIDKVFSETPNYAVNLAISNPDDKLYVMGAEEFVATEVDSVYTTYIHDAYRKCFPEQRVPENVMNFLCQATCKLIAFFEKYEPLPVRKTERQDVQCYYIEERRDNQKFSITEVVIPNLIKCILADIIFLTALDSTLSLHQEWYMFLQRYLIDVKPHYGHRNKRSDFLKLFGLPFGSDYDPESEVKNIYIKNGEEIELNKQIYEMRTTPTKQRLEYITSIYPQLLELSLTWTEFLFSLAPLFIYNLERYILITETFLNPCTVVENAHFFLEQSFPYRNVLEDSKPPDRSDLRFIFQQYLFQNRKTAASYFKAYFLVHCVKKEPLTCFSFYVIVVLLSFDLFYPTITKFIESFFLQKMNEERDEICKQTYLFIDRYCKINIPMLRLVCEESIVHAGHQVFIDFQHSHNFLVKEQYEKFTVFSKLHAALLLYLETLADLTSKLQVYVPFQLADNQAVYTFTLNQFVSFVLVYEPKPEPLPDSAFQQVQTFAQENRQPLELQTTEIAINEGSTKTFVEAVLTETIQNSIDAISAAPAGTIQEIRVYLKESPEYLVYQITDFVGIPFDGIMSLLVPFLSSKLPSESITGEMGSGFFNVYRESAEVFVNTSFNNITTFIHGIPQRNLETQRVTNVNLQVQRYEKESPNKTDVVVVMKKTNTIENTVLMSKFLNYIYKVFSLVPMEELFFNDSPVKTSTLKLCENELFQSRFITDASIQSYLFTKNVPFLPLEDFVKYTDLLPSVFYTALTRHLVVNVKHGVYTPVQTRARIQMSNENKQHMQKFLLESLYFGALKKITSGLYDSHSKLYDELLPNFTNTSSLNQLVPHVERLDDVQSVPNFSYFMLHYKPGPENPTFASLIQSSFGIMQNTKFEDLTKRQEELLSSLSSLPEQTQALMKWLQSKNLNAIAEEDFEEDDDVSEGDQVLLQKVEQFFQKFVSAYWDLGKLVGVIQLKKQAPKVFCKKLKTGDLGGFYQLEYHTITINADLLLSHKTSLFVFLNLLKTLTPLTIQSKLEQNFIYKRYLKPLPASILLHEVEHAIRNEGCNEGTHDSKWVQIPPDTPKRNLSFEDGLVQRALYIIRKGLWNRVLDGVAADDGADGADDVGELEL